MSKENFLNSHVGKNINMARIQAVEKLYQEKKKKKFSKEIQQKREEFLRLEQEQAMRDAWTSV
jgi:hypothetical protein